MMQRSRSLLGWTLLLVLGLCGCAGDGSSSAEASARIVAYVNEEPITAEELLQRLEAEHFELVDGALKQMAAEKLFDMEAAARGITRDELIQAEIKAKISGPSQQEIDRFYQQRQATMQGRTLEEMRPQIAAFLQQQKFFLRRTEYANELKDQMGFRAMLEPPRADIEIPMGAPVRGSEDAPVTIVEFADFECAACRSAYPIIERLLLDYGDTIRFAFRDFPLPNHPRAIPASEAAMCAADQERFWDYYQNLMVMAGPLDDADLERRAQQLELDMTRFADCYGSRRFSAEVRSAFEQGRAIGVDSTPTLFINGRRVVGVLNYEALSEIVEEELARARQG